MMDDITKDSITVIDKKVHILWDNIFKNMQIAKFEKTMLLNVCKDSLLELEKCIFDFPFVLLNYDVNNLMFLLRKFLKYFVDGDFNDYFIIETMGGFYENGKKVQVAPNSMINEMLNFELKRELINKYVDWFISCSYYKHGYDKVKFSCVLCSLNVQCPIVLFEDHLKECYQFKTFMFDIDLLFSPMEEIHDFFYEYCRVLKNTIINSKVKINITRNLIVNIITFMSSCFNVIVEYNIYHMDKICYLIFEELWRVMKKLLVWRGLFRISNTLFVNFINHPDLIELKSNFKVNIEYNVLRYGSLKIPK